MQTIIQTGFSHPQIPTSNFPIGSMQISEKDFHQFLTIKQGLADNSIRHAMIRIRIINAWLETNELTKESIERFFMSLKEKGLKNNSLNTYKFVLSQLVEYCKDRELPFNFLDGFKTFKKTKPDIIILTPDEIKLLTDTSLTYGIRAGIDCSFLDFRYRTLNKFLGLTGCRCMEALNLKIKNVDFYAGRAVLIETKNNENRSVYFTEPLISDLKTLVGDRKGDELVFINSKNTKINVTDYSADLKRRAKAAGIIKKIHPHIFRHSFATQLLIEGVDVSIVSKILGHKDIRTTVDNYLHLADETLKDATFMHPLTRININPVLLIKMAKENLEKLHFEKDQRFNYSLSEDGKSLKFQLSINK